MVKNNNFDRFSLLTHFDFDHDDRSRFGSRLVVDQAFSSKCDVERNDFRKMDDERMDVELSQIRHREKQRTSDLGIFHFH